MAEAQKGTSTADLNNKSSSIDEDFGKGFLNSWKSSKKGNDTINFDVDINSRKNKKAFDFDKLDDFELGGDFDKLPSFNMPDLDFSSPLKKIEKTKEKSCKEDFQEKHELKRENFSFTFDFNELDKFDFESNLLKGSKASSKYIDDNGPACSIKHDEYEGSRKNSAMTIDVFRNDESKKLQFPDNMGISRSMTLTEPHTVMGADPSTSSNNKQHDISSEAVTSMEKKLMAVKERQFENNDCFKSAQDIDGACSLKQDSVKNFQGFSFQSVSGDSSSQLAPPRFGIGSSPLDPVKSTSTKALDDRVKSTDSSQSRNSSPANSYNSRSWQKTHIVESPNMSGEILKCQGNRNVRTGGIMVLIDSSKCQKDFEKDSTDFSQKNDHESKHSGNKLSSSSKFLLSPLYRGSTITKFLPVKEKASTALGLKPLIKSADMSQATSTLNQKHLYSVDHGKLKSAKCPSSENRQTQQNDEMLKVGILKSNDKGSAKSIIKGVSLASASDKEHNMGETSRIQLRPSNLLGITAASSNMQSIIPSLVLSSPLSSQKTPVEIRGISQKNDKACDTPNLKKSRMTKLHIQILSSATQKETKSIHFSERNLELLPNTASRVNKEKYSLLSPSLKRKAVKESKADLESLNPSKRLMESTTGRRKSLEAMSRISEKVVRGPEKPEPHADNVSPDILTSFNGVTEVGIAAGYEVPASIENDGNIEKAEACAKELDNICRMIKKKHEEAKELLVRVIVNNNSLLLLNHPTYEEKICALQKFASSLQSKNF